MRKICGLSYDSGILLLMSRMLVNRCYDVQVVEQRDVFCKSQNWSASHFSEIAEMWMKALWNFNPIVSLYLWSSMRILKLNFYCRRRLGTLILMPLHFSINLMKQNEDFPVSLSISHHRLHSHRFSHFISKTRAVCIITCGLCRLEAAMNNNEAVCIYIDLFVRTSLVSTIERLPRRTHFPLLVNMVFMFINVHFLTHTDTHPHLQLVQHNQHNHNVRYFRLLFSTRAALSIAATGWPLSPEPVRWIKPLKLVWDLACCSLHLLLFWIMDEWWTCWMV